MQMQSEYDWTIRWLPLWRRSWVLGHILPGEVLDSLADLPDFGLVRRRAAHTLRRRLRGVAAFLEFFCSIKLRAHTVLLGRCPAIFEFVVC